MTRERGEQQVEQRKSFELGIKGLNELIGTINGPYTILIEGHPGAGKTTMALTICYYNTTAGHRCLYITVYEDKEKLYNNAERLGLLLRDAEKKGLFRFIRIPVTSNINDVLEVIGRNVEEGFDIVVVDTITAILELAGSADKRAYLLNYFYQVPLVNKGLMVLVSELPYGIEKIEGGSEEFVADAVFTLKHRIEGGFLVRILEIRKLRGKPYSIAELPFTISESHGISVYVPIAPETIPWDKEELYIPCQALSSKIGHLHRGFLVNTFYPPDTIYGRDALLIVLGIAVKYGLRVLVISYLSSPATLKDAICNWLIRAGLEPETATRLIDKYMVIEAINPYAQSLTELALKEIELVEKVKPNIVVFHGTHAIVVEPYEKYFRELFNQVLRLKQMGVGIFRVTSCISEIRCKAEASIADLNFMVQRVYKDGNVDFVTYTYRRYIEPAVLGRKEIFECMEEIINYIKTNASVT